MDLRVLKYFLAMAREENITKAAALLHLTQPTLSRQLMQLEEELGVKLFQRSRHRIVLTDDGMLLRRRAQELVDLADKTVQEFRKEPELRGVISIGSGDLEGMHLLAGWLASFQALHPQVTYQLYSGNADNTRERIEGGMLDLALLLEGKATGAERLRMLEKKRAAALDEIHFKERQLQRLDYLRHEIRKTQKGTGGK